MSDDPWEFIGADEELLLATEKSTDGWQRRAVGMPTEAAMARAPKQTPIQTWLPLGLWVRVKTHIADQQLTKAEWLRRAIATQYEAEGGDPDVATQIRNVRTRATEPVE